MITHPCRCFGIVECADLRPGHCFDVKHVGVAEVQLRIAAPHDAEKCLLDLAHRVASARLLMQTLVSIYHTLKFEQEAGVECVDSFYMLHHSSIRSRRLGMSVNHSTMMQHTGSTVILAAKPFRTDDEHIPRGLFPPSSIHPPVRPQCLDLDQAMRSDQGPKCAPHC